MLWKKEKVYRILTFVFIILTFVCARYVLSNKGQVNAGYAIIPSLFVPFLLNCQPMKW